jgi:hypothetical protein
MYIGFHVKYPLLLPDFNDIWILEKYSRIIFYASPSSGSRAGPCRRTDITMAYTGIFFRGGLHHEFFQGGSTNSVEDREQ